MAEIERVGVSEARGKLQANTALLVCAYEDEEKWKKMRLEGSISLPILAAQAETLPKNKELIFYCG